MNEMLTISLQGNLMELVHLLGEPAAVVPAAVRQYVVDRCLQRLEAAEAKVGAYVQRYGMDYKSFNGRATTDQAYLDQLNQDHPLWESDAIEWVYRIEEVELWRERLTKALQTTSRQTGPLATVDEYVAGKSLAKAGLTTAGHLRIL